METAGRLDRRESHVADRERARTSLMGDKPRPFPTWSVSLYLLGILLLAVGVRVVSFNGYAGSDDASYAELAFSLSRGTFHPGEYVGPPVFPLRIGVFAPVALLFWIFGPSEVAMLVYPVFISLLCVGLAYWGGSFLLGQRAGLFAAALVAVLPLASRSATVLMADLPAAVWGNIGILLLFAGSRRDTRGQAALAAVGGLALGVSWLCKESVIYLFPFAFSYALWVAPRGWRRLVVPTALALGFGLVLLAEGLVYARLTGDFAHRFHEIHRNYEYQKTWFFAEGTRYGWAAGEYQSAVLNRLFREGPLTIFASPTFGGVTAAAIPAVVYALYRRDRSLVLLSLWFLSLAFMFNFASSSLRSYQPLVMFDKYLYPLLFPAALLVAGFVDRLLFTTEQERSSGRVVRLVTAGALISVVGFGCLLGTARNFVSGAKNRVERQLASQISPDTTFYTDRRTLRILEFFWGFPEQTGGRDFQGLAAGAVRPGAYVLVNPEKLRFLRGNYEYAVPEFCEQVPEGWEPALTAGKAILYRTPTTTASQPAPAVPRPAPGRPEMAQTSASNQEGLPGKAPQPGGPAEGSLPAP